jgi:hypothetical protein
MTIIILQKLCTYDSSSGDGHVHFAAFRSRKENTSGSVRWWHTCWVFVLTLAVSEPDTRPSSLYRVATHCRSGPRESCRHCKAAATVYSVHLPCLSILHQSTASRISSGDDDWALRCAQAMALAPIQVRQASKPISFAESSENIIEKLCPQTRLSKLLCRIQCTLPVELHALIISFMSDSPGGDVLFSREARAVLSELQSSPEKRHRSISCSGALFARWGSRGQLPSLAGLYEDKLKGSQQIEVDDESWAFIVLHWNDSRITKMEWVGHETSLVLPATNRYTSYQVIRRPKSNLLWITMEVSIMFPASCISKLIPP